MANLKTVKVPKPDTSPSAIAARPNWSTVNELKPFYDRTVNEYVVIVVTKSDTTENLNEDRIAAKRTGIIYLMNFYDKKMPFNGFFC